MSTNDEVRVDIHEIENAETSPQEHDNEMDTTASQNQSSSEQIVEIRTSPLQDQVVRINIAQENEEHEKMDELVISPPSERIVGSKNGSFEEVGEDVTTKHGSFEEIEEHVTSLPYEDQADYSKTKEDIRKLRRAVMSDKWNKVYKDIFKEDPSKYSNYLIARTKKDGKTLLHSATERNSVSFVKELVNYMTEDQLTIKTSDGCTAFFVAASYGRVEFAKVMFEKNELLPSIRGKLEMLPIHVAAQEGRTEMVEFLYRIQGPLEELDRNRLFLNVKNRVYLFDDPMINEDLEKLYILTQRNDWNTAYRDIFKENPIENSKYLTARISKKEDTTLHVAIATRSYTFAKELIKYMKGEYLAIKNTDGDTAFSLVVASGNVRLAKQMFEKNAKQMFEKNDELPYIHEANQMLPIQVTDQQGRKLMEEFINKTQGSFEEMDNNESSAIASQNGSFDEIVENVAFLYQAQADDERIMEIHRILSNFAMHNDWNKAYRDIFKRDPFKNSDYLTAKLSKKGDNVLHLATKNNSVKFVKELMKYMLKEELAITNNDGDTAFSLAVRNGMMDVAKVMFEKNRWLPSIRGYFDDLPIHRAAKLDHKEMIKFLYGIQGPLQEIDSNRLFLNLRDRVSLFDDSWKIYRNLENLYTAASSNDWNGAYNDIFESDPVKNSTYLTARVSEKEDTALHIAAKTKSFRFFEELLKYMKKEHLAIKNIDGNSPFFLIAESGDVRLAKKMFEKNAELPIIRGEKEMLPIHKAAEQGHKMVVDFLNGIQQPLEEMDKKKLFYYSREGHYSIKKLCVAASKDDWKTARKIYDDHPDYINDQISQEGDTALHIAVAAQSSVFVQNLVKIMDRKDLTIKNHDGNTAFHIAVASGNLKLAKKMFDKNRELQSILGENEMLPINMAAQSGHKEMVNFLYKDYPSISNNEDKYLNKEDHCKLFHSLIRTGIYDVALKLLEEKPQLATYREESSGETALLILGRTPVFANKKGSDKVRQERPQKLPPEALVLVKRLLQRIKSLDEETISKIIDYTGPVIFDALEKGNIEFLTIVIHEFPKLILKVDQKKHSIFHVAVLNRQKDIFRTIHEIAPSLKKLILQYKDDEENNILHLAGKMPSGEQLNNVLGVALQLQQELFWFKEVSKIVDPMDVEAKNKNNKTPTDLLNEKTTKLKDKGEKWMKDIANSCMIVATLITTVAFAAAFTVPGGTKDDTGTPHFIQKVSFIIFVISDAIALASSACSILTILSIYTARYTDEDFVLLPRNLVVGLSTLFLSIAAVMVVFCATIFIVFKDGKIWVPILASVIAYFPVILLAKQNQQLFFGVARLIYGKSFLSKTSKHSLFEDDDDDEGKSWNLKKRKDATCWNFLVKCWDSIHYRCSNFLEERWNSTCNRFFD